MTWVSNLHDLGRAADWRSDAIREGAAGFLSTQYLGKPSQMALIRPAEWYFKGPFIATNSRQKLYKVVVFQVAFNGFYSHQNQQQAEEETIVVFQVVFWLVAS